MMTKGMARLRAAKAVGVKKLPTNTPSISWYSDEASMLTAPGSDARKNRRTGGVWENSVVEFIQCTCNMKFFGVRRAHCIRNKQKVKPRPPAAETGISARYVV